MITLITGLPGSGKTLFTLKTVNDIATKDNRQVYYHGIPELTLGWNVLEDPTKWHELPQGSIIVIDECQSTFRPRGNGTAVPEHVAKLETHRHKGFDIYLLTQHPMLLDGNVRRLVGRHYHSVRFYGFAKSKIHEFNEVRDNVDKNRKNSIENHFVYPKEVYSWYKSADLHTVKKRIPMRLVLLFVLPMMTIAALYVGYISLKDLGHKSPEQKTGVLNGQIQSLPTTPQVEPKLSYYEAHQPVLFELPHTAPVYAKIIEPVRAPVPAACIQSSSKCNCYSEQGTFMKVDDAMCKKIVKEGIYIDWDNAPKEKQQEQPLLLDAQHVDQQSLHTDNAALRESPLNLPS